MISASITAGLDAFQAAVTDAAPLAATDVIQRAALLTQGNRLLSAIDVALVGAAGGLDADDPAGLPTVAVMALLGLAVAGQDQEDLANLRGLVGRAVFNLAQVEA